MKLALIFTSLFCLIFSSISSQTSSIITIDYNIDEGASNQVASGMLHGIDAVPSQYLIDGLKINAIRGADYYPNLPSYFEQPIYDRAIATGAKLMIGLYYHRDPGQFYPDTGTFDAWATICKDIYNEAQTRNLDVYSWITWNEPRLQWGNSGTNRQRYFAAHDVAYKAVKSINPEARIQAPEDHAYNFEFMKQFLNFCKTNNCIPEVLAWHELSPDPLDVEAHCLELKTWMLNNGINPMPMAVTEYQGQSYSNDFTSIPGVNVYYLASMERAVKHGFEFGLHACWSRTGEDPQFVATLADMATYDNPVTPRGLWWNYNAYKDMTGRKVGVNVIGANSDALASSDDAMKRSVILIGTRNYFTAHDVSLTLNNIPDYLTTNSKVNIRVELISDAMVLTNPEVVIANDYVISNNAVTLTLPQMAPKSSYAIYVTAATNDAAITSYEVENLTIKSSFTTGTPHYTFNETIASGGFATALEANAIGDFVEYTIPSPGAGIYNVSAIFKSGPNRGFLQVYVDGKATFPPEDLYENVNTYYENDFGNIELGTEDLNLRFEVVGQHPNTTGNIMVFDRFDLTRLGNAPTASTNDVANTVDLKIYPNPTSDNITIKMDTNFGTNSNLYLYDNTGRVMINKKLPKNINTIDISHLTSGIYFVKIINAEHTIIKRITKK
ncbi:T9SS type A sorting domain-containing protein [Thalassobellus sediminis]|uniref:T9SS type A sorting domain-containing protein n=1 Tax=Thalassobellus sediminis TaxID=3367753 RepID=UPI0037A6B1E4